MSIDRNWSYSHGQSVNFANRSLNLPENLYSIVNLPGILRYCSNVAVLNSTSYCYREKQFNKAMSLHYQFKMRHIHNYVLFNLTFYEWAWGFFVRFFVIVVGMLCFAQILWLFGCCWTLLLVFSLSAGSVQVFWL